MSSPSLLALLFCLPLAACHLTELGQSSGKAGAPGDDTDDADGDDTADRVDTNDSQDTGDSADTADTTDTSADTSETGDTSEPKTPDCELYGFSAAGSVLLDGSSRADSYDSTVGPYEGENITGEATLTTNATTECAIRVTSASMVYGEVFAGPGGSPDLAVCLEWGGGVSGAQRTLPSAVTIPPVATPEGMPASEGDMNLEWGGSDTFGEDHTFGSLHIASGATLRIRGSVRVWCMAEFTLEGATLIIEDGARLELYVGGEASFTWASNANSESQDPSRFRIFMLGSSDLEISSSSNVYAVAQSPQGALAMSTGHLYGSFVGDSISAAWSAGLHTDLARICAR